MYTITPQVTPADNRMKRKENGIMKNTPFKSRSRKKGKREQRADVTKKKQKSQIIALNSKICL